jgi:phosphoribosylanthranilate isomerase
MMHTIHFPRVKICCISSKEEASLAISYGASVLGLVGPMPGGPGIISNTTIRSIARIIPPGVDSFLLSSETNASAIIEHHKKTQTRTIQLVDEVELSEFQIIRSELPLVKLVQVIHVVDETALGQALKIAPYVDAILLDSGNPKLEVKELGGTGRTHNWEISRQIRDKIEIPVFLAGGLDANNIRDAVDLVQPFGVDLCSGVRTNGKLDEIKLRNFFNRINYTV